MPTVTKANRKEMISYLLRQGVIGISSTSTTSEVRAAMERFERKQSPPAPSGSRYVGQRSYTPREHDFDTRYRYNGHIQLTSKNRHNGGVRAKRQYGSSTITEFWVEVDGILQPWTVSTGGRTPGERKTAARELAERGIESGRYQVKR